MRFVDSLTPEQSKMLEAAIRVLRETDANVFLGDRLADAFERKPRVREVWMHENVFGDRDDGFQWTVYNNEPTASKYVKVRITEVL